MNRLYDRPGSIPMRAVSIALAVSSGAAFATSPWRLSHAKIGAALFEAQRPSRGPFLRLNVRSHEAAREQHRRLTANSRENVILP